ncbi:MAG: riboflavin synthase subunit beta [Flavobacteriaceae bacterium]|nr:riboflavin synthase subunit beta [Flavobacteriaceae bacterium]MCB0476196.1 riboflavin synthase subunit beta [Flavobacteriaceae bacterium]
MKLIRRKPKKFEYIPRYYKGEGNPHEIKHRFDEFRSTLDNNKSLKTKLNDAISELKDPENKGYNKTIIIIALILILLFLWLIEFDLSIFVPR